MYFRFSAAILYFQALGLAGRHRYYVIVIWRGRKPYVSIWNFNDILSGYGETMYFRFSAAILYFQALGLAGRHRYYVIVIGRGRKPYVSIWNINDILSGYGEKYFRFWAAILFFGAWSMSAIAYIQFARIGLSRYQLLALKF
jgi:hypothetical protein